MSMKFGSPVSVPIELTLPSDFVCKNCPLETALGIPDPYGFLPLILPLSS